MPPSAIPIATMLRSSKIVRARLTCLDSRTSSDPGLGPLVPQIGSRASINAFGVSFAAMANPRKNCFQQHYRQISTSGPTPSIGLGLNSRLAGDSIGARGSDDVGFLEQDYLIKMTRRKGLQ